MYFDTAYVAKFYVDDLDSNRVRDLVETTGVIQSSGLVYAEFHGVLHRRTREGSISARTARDLAKRFADHVDCALWQLIPVNDALLQRTGAALLSARSTLFLRSSDTVHLVTAREAGEREIWTSDRHMLAAARYFGLVGRSV